MPSRCRNGVHSTQHKHTHSEKKRRPFYTKCKESGCINLKFKIILKTTKKTKRKSLTNRRKCWQRHTEQRTRKSRQRKIIIRRHHQPNNSNALAHWYHQPTTQITERLTMASPLQNCQNIIQKGEKASHLVTRTFLNSLRSLAFCIIIGIFHVVRFLVDLIGRTHGTNSYCAVAVLKRPYFVFEWCLIFNLIVCLLAHSLARSFALHSLWSAKDIK